MNSPSASAFNLWPEDPAFNHLFCCRFPVHVGQDVPFLSINKLAVPLALPPRCTEMEQLQGEDDSNWTITYIKCNSLERLRDLFCYCSPSRGLQVPADFDTLPPLSQGTFCQVALHTLVGIFAWREQLSSGPLAALHECCLFQAQAS